MAARSGPLADYTGFWEGFEEAVPPFLAQASQAIVVTKHVTFPKSCMHYANLPPRPINPNILVKTSQPFMGVGVRTIAPINRDRTVAIYGGELKSDDFSIDSPYVIRVFVDNHMFFLDGGKPTGTIASFINHSCDPNCAIADYMYHGQLLVVIVSLRKIQPLEFLSVNYGNLYGTFDVCMCGSPICRSHAQFLDIAKSGQVPSITFF